MTLNEQNLEKRFSTVSTSQGSIQSLSFFCLHYKTYHKRIAKIWLRSIQKARVSHRLTLIYLANDIVQNAKRKNTLTFIDAFRSVLKDTIPYLKDEKIKKSVERVFSIWQDREIFDAKFTNELKGLLQDHPSETNVVESLNKLAEIERNEEDHVVKLKNEIDERTKLCKLLEESCNHQKKLLKQSEEQLDVYKSQLDSIIKHKQEIE